MTTIRPTTHHRYHAHPVGDRRRYEMQAGSWGWSLLVQGIATGLVLFLFLVAIPFAGLVVGSALGIDVAVLP